jgi:hypothetical protein
MGHKALSKLQLGKETTAGTLVAADTIWRGPFAGLKDGRNTEPVEEDIGIALKSSRRYSASLLAELSMPVTNLTPEQSPHVFEAGIKTVETGVADGSASSGYVYTYPFGTTAINSVSSYSIESGDEDGAEVAEYMFVSGFTITAVKGESVKISSDWMGRQVAAQAFTGALSAPAVTEISVNSGVIYIDEPSGTMGATPISAGNIMEMTLTVKTGRVALHTADSGNLYFVEQYFNVDEFEATLELKWLWDTAAIAEKAKWQSDTARLIRVEFTGEDYATPGTGTLFTGGKSGIQISMPGSYDEFSALEHDEGKSIVTATLSGGYENESGEALEIVIASELAAIP